MRTILPFSRVPRRSAFAKTGVPRRNFRAKTGSFASFVGKSRVLDLCCGMGGLSVAAREMEMRMMTGVDVNPSALCTFARSFPEAEAIERSVRLSISGTGLRCCEGLSESHEQVYGASVVKRGVKW